MSDKPIPYPWAELGLSGPASDKEIKRAYATALKSIDRQNDVEKFQTLRGAYEFARKIAKRDPIDPEHISSFDNEEESSNGFAEEPSENKEPQFDDNENDKTDTEPEQADSGSSQGFVEVGEESETVFQTDVIDLAANYRALIKEMEQLVQAKNYDLAVWSKLLNDEVFDDISISHDFQTALINALCEAYFPISETISTPSAWVELIETRYGWIADGLQFQRQFPGTAPAKLRNALCRKSQVWRSIEYTRDESKVQPTVPFYEHILNMLSTPTAISIALSLALLCVSFLLYRAAPGAVNYFVVSALLSFPLSHLIFAISPAYYITSKMLTRLRLGAFNRLLAGRKLIPVLFGVCSWVFLALVLTVLSVPTEAPRDIARVKFSHAEPFSELTRELIGKKSVIRNGRPRKLLGSFEPGLDSASELLSELELPYPIVFLSEVGVNSRVSSGRAIVTCTREDDNCQALIKSGLRLQIEGYVVDIGIITRKLEREPTLVRFSAKKDSQSVSVKLDNYESKIDLFLRKIDRSRFFRTGGYSKFHALDINALGLDEAGFIKNLKLTAALARPESDGWKIFECVENLTNRDGNSAAFIRNPKGAEMIEELCTLPTDSLKLSMRACIQDLHQSCDSIIASRFALVPGTVGDELPPEEALTLLQSVPAEKSGRFEVQLNRDSDLVLTALLNTWAGHNTVLTGRAKSKAIETSDQIIRDYLTVIWDSDRPKALAQYLEAHPEIVLDSSPPTRLSLSAAVHRQPHLSYLYPVPKEAGTIILADMFNFLEATNMLR